MLPYSAIVAATGDSNPAVVAARKRQETVKTLEIKFKQTDIIAPGGVSDKAPPMYKPASLVPPKETTVQSVNRYVIAENKIRFENNHPSWRMPQGRLLERGALSVTNGKDGLLLFPTGIGAQGTAEGIIEKNAQIAEFQLFVLAPINLTLRAFDPVVCAYPLEEWKRSGTTRMVGGVQCEEYLDSRSTITRHYWLAPKQDHVIRQVQVIERGKLRDQCDIDYTKNDICGWMPTAWRWSQHTPTGKLAQTTKIEVLEYRLNETQPAEQFELKFPPGCRVHNNKNSKEYLVKDDGTMREQSRTGEELPDVVFQPQSPWVRRHQWELISAALALLLLIVGLVAWRKRAARSV